MVKNPPAYAGDASSIPGLGISPGGGNGSPLQYSCLENPMDRRAWQATAHGFEKSWIRLSTLQKGCLLLYEWPLCSHSSCCSSTVPAPHSGPPPRLGSHTGWTEQVLQNASHSQAERPTRVDQYNTDGDL